MAETDLPSRRPSTKSSRVTPISQAPCCRSCMPSRMPLATSIPRTWDGSQQALNLSRAEVHGVISFYHYFRQRPAGRHVVHCAGPRPARRCAASRPKQHAKVRLGVDYGGTSADGVFTLAAVYCLGNCAAAPSVMIDEKLYGRVTPERLDECSPTGGIAVSVRIYVSRDASAQALGADETVAALQVAAAATWHRIAHDPRRFARHGLARTARRGRGSTAGHASPTARSPPRMSPNSLGRSLCRGTARVVYRSSRRPALVRAAGAPDICTRRRHRSGQCR